jgi:hypothetical protein
MPIDKQMVNSLFRANGVKDECPACGKANQRFGNDKVSLPYVQDTNTTIPAPSLHAVPTICKNCGYIRLFLDKED